MVEVTPKEWAIPGLAAFVPWVANTFMYDGKEETEYMLQQRFVRDYLQHDGPYRGVVLYHGLGSGKTCSAIAATEALRSAGHQKVYVMLPASLKRNYLREVRKCGSAWLRESQRWSFLAAGLDAPPTQVLVDKKLLKDHGGEWVPDEKGRPYDTLTQRERDQVRAQIDDRITKTHHFVSYNGLNVQSVRKLCAGLDNVFDDAVVIIDEVHNLISAVSNGGLVTRVYDRIMAAQRCKVVLLSGTPLVNRPEELALLVNLAHGPVRVHDFVLTGPMDDHRRRQLAQCPDVMAFQESLARDGRRLVNVVSVRLVPEGFERTGHAFVQRSQADLTDMSRRVRDILEPRSVKARDLMLLPTDAAEFRRFFVDQDSNTVRNVGVLQRRIMSTVSFFQGHAKSLYPSLDRVLIVPSPLSARQFSEYSVQRASEIRKEDTARRLAGMRRAAGVGGDDAELASYRPFSRAVCNFVFPEEVPRPYKGDIVVAEADSDASTLSVGPPLSEEAATSAERAYLQALDAAIQKLREKPHRMALGPDGLDQLSPKFAAVTRHLLGLRDAGGPASRSRALDDESMPAFVDTSSISKSKPKQSGGRASNGSRKQQQGGRLAIVYSQFRRAEGVAILAAALDANGFAELSVRHVADPRDVRKSHLELTIQGKPLREAILDEELVTRPRYIMYSNDDQVAASCMIAMYNNQLDSSDIPPSVADTVQLLFKKAGTEPSNLRGQLAQVMLITRSGSEGISTRNVREVHILEPFWHANRIEQVIGRARRAHSHDQLPPQERFVDVFIYMATLTSEQAKRQHKRDGGKTSDEYVHDVSQRKRRVLKGLLGAMRTAAVDCRLHAKESGDQCLSLPAGIDPAAPLYKLELAEDVKDAKGPDADHRELIAVRVSGKLFYADKHTGALYDYAAMKDRSEVVQVGQLEHDALQAIHGR
jgi:hypothetical protein